MLLNIVCDIKRFFLEEKKFIFDYDEVDCNNLYL